MDINTFKEDIIDRLQMFYPEKTRVEIEEMIKRHGTIEKFKDVIEDA